MGASRTVVTMDAAGSGSYMVALGIDGALAADDYAQISENLPYCVINTVAANTRYGGKITFTSKNLTNSRWLRFRVSSQAYGFSTSDRIDTLANGGMRIYFIDGSGNAAGWNIWGTDIPNNSDGGADDWVFGAWQGSTPRWSIERTRTPDFAIGSINWADIVAAGWSYKSGAAGFPWGSFRAGFGDVLAFNDTIGTGTVSLNDFRNVETNGNGGDQRTFGLSFRWLSSVGSSYISHLPWQIGDGATPTTHTVSNTNIGFVNTMDAHPAHFVPGPVVQLATPARRTIDVYQSASDNVSFTDVLLAAGSNWGLKIRGNAAGTAAFTRCTFRRANEFVCGHGRFASCIFEGCLAVELSNGNSGSMTSCALRGGGASSDGLKVIGAAGDYSAVTVQFSENSGKDLTIVPPAPGTWNFSGVSAPSGYTLKIHNASATHAITVQLPTGATYSTTTAGGGITVISPSPTLELKGLVAGSEVRVYVGTDPLTMTELAGVESSGTSFSTAHSNTGQAGTVVIFATGYQTIRIPITFSAAAASIPVQQSIDRVFENT